MKTAISIPDSLFKETEALAKTLGLNRSALYRTALEFFLRKHREAELVHRINEVCSDVDTSLPADLEQAVVTTLGRHEWED